MLDRLIQVYSQVKIGDPWDDSVLLGPLINERAVETMMAALVDARRQGERSSTAADEWTGRATSSNRPSSKPGPTWRSSASRHSRRSCM